MPAALLYGHSQTGGMGLDMRNALRAAGFDVTIDVNNGKADPWLLANLPNLGDLGQYSRVVAYLGGNTDTGNGPQIVQIAQSLGGPDKVAVVLPPINVDDPPSPAKMARNAVHVEALQSAGFRVYMVQAPGSSFWDGVHLNHGTVASMDLAKQIMADWKVGAPWWVWAIGVGVVMGGIGWWRRQRG